MSSNKNGNTTKSGKSIKRLFKKIFVPEASESPDYITPVPRDSEIGAMVIDKLEVIDKIGQGGFAKVYKCKSKQTEEIRALKARYLKSQREGNLDPTAIPEIKTGFELINIRHPNIVRIYEHFARNGWYFIIMEYCNGGDLGEYLNQHGSLSHPLARHWFTEICNGIKYLHTECKIAHRDIKAENILLQNNIVKVSDFTFARRFWDEKNNRLMLTATNCGTLIYCSPQKLLVKHTGIWYSPFADDMWALGVLLYYMLTYHYPYIGYNNRDLIRDHHKELGPLFRIHNVSNEAADLIERLLNKKEFARITIENTLKHEWMLDKNEIIFVKRPQTTLGVIRPISLREESQSGTSDKIVVAAPEDTQIWVDILENDNLAKILSERYQIEKWLKQGEITMIYLGKCRKTQQYRVIKLFNLTDVMTSKEVCYGLETVKKLEQIDHKYLVKIYESFGHDDWMFIVMEYCNGGDLDGYLQQNGSLSETLACFWFLHICKALKYLHNELKVAHRNIMTTNILLQDNLAKLTDFRYARKFWNEETKEITTSSTQCGMKQYFSPQKIKTPCQYNPFANDIWSMGVLLFFMLNNRYPFYIQNLYEMLDSQTIPNYLEIFLNSYPADLRDFQEKLFQVNEKDRIVIDKIFTHKWILRKKLQIYFRRKFRKVEIKNL